MRRKRQRPMTEEERRAFRFKAIKINFNHTNEEWATMWLPWVRLAIASLDNDDKDLECIVGNMLKQEWCQIYLKTSHVQKSSWKHW
jgi:hypothetical protein